MEAMKGKLEGVDELKKLELSAYSNTDILITVPTKNVEETVTNIVGTVDQELTQYSPDKTCLIVIVDGFSTDATRENGSTCS